MRRHEWLLALGENPLDEITEVVEDAPANAVEDVRGVSCDQRRARVDEPLCSVRAQIAHYGIILRLSRRMIRAGTDAPLSQTRNDESPVPGKEEEDMIGEITLIPQLEGPGRGLIKKAVEEIDAAGLKHQVGPTSTSVEGELEDILEAVRAIEGRLRAEGVSRAMIEIRLQLEPHPETLEHQVEGIKDT